MTIKDFIKQIINWIMANYDVLKQAIRDAVYPNAEYEITGQNLQDVLIAMVNALGEGYNFKGVATPSTNPETPDDNVFYIGGAGTYPNFGPATVKAGEIGIFRYNGSWSCSVIQTDTTTDVININAIANHPAGYTTPALALADVPERYRKLGCTVVFKDDTTEEWVMMIYKDDFGGDDAWTDIDNNWRTIGPVYLRQSGWGDGNYILQIGLNADFRIINNFDSDTPYHVLSAKQGRLLNEKIEGWTQELESIDTTGVQLSRPLLQGMIITKIEGATKLILVGQFEEAITPADLPYKMQHNAYSVKTESGTATDVTIGVRGVLSDDFINVNDYYGHSAAYASAQAARADVALTERKKGLYITYLLSVDANTTLWVTDQFIGDDITNWGVADNWKVIGPVTVTQNTTTNSDGNGTINIGGTYVGKYAGADKLIKLVAIASSRPSDIQLGECYYNTNSKHIVRRIDAVEETEIVPFYDGAIYQYDSYLYVWNGEDLVPVSEVRNNELYGDKVGDIQNSGNTIHLHSGLKADNIHYIEQQVFSPLASDNIIYEWGKHVTKGITYDILSYLGAVNCTIVVDGDGPQAFRIQAKNKRTGNPINLCDFSSSPQSLPFTFNNARPDLELIDVTVYTSATYGIDGNLSVKFTKASSLKDLKTQADKSTEDISNIQSNLAKTSTDVASVSEDVFNIKTNNLSYIFRKKIVKGETYNIISYLGYTPCTFVIDGDGPQAFRIQAKNKKTGNTINICDYASNPQTLPVTIERPRTDLELIDVTVYTSATYGVDGDLSVKITRESPFVKDTPSYKGCFQFGRGLNLNYDTGSVNALDTAQMFSLAYWYGLYDSLVTAYPNYVSKVDCDTEFLTDNPSVTRPTELDDMPIYMYKFTPAYPDGNAWGATTKVDRFKVFITTGTHPEYIAMWDCFQTMLKICSLWNSNDNLRQLRHNVEFYIIPCSGPWGITHATRTNHNGVDLNRNMPTPTWELTPQGDTYSGPTPASEYETKLLVYELNKINPLVFIDHHNFGVNAGKNMMFGTSYNKNIIDALCDWEMEMDGRLKNLYPTEFPQNDTDLLYQYVADGEGTGTRSSWSLVAKRMYCMTIETTYASYWNNGVYQTTATHIRDAFICSVATNIFLNALLIILESVARTTPPIEII